ncbi:unnamed protein product [Mytilus coruscus]|uniref:Mab-21-like HhH/H2TH-like domain-containing protein n=1 Tax=Mytilus coruscus TaxID=42192 RepID=A0A6J8DYX3_MYTCO|nr:unnamed protein product [Mytilus coruscus]
MLQTHGSNRSSFLTKLQLRENNRKETHADVRIYIQSLFQNTVKLLKETYSVFRNSELHLAGSMGEQTKVGRPDEFDFVIILPQLSEIDIFYPYRMDKNKHIREYAKDFNFGYPDAFTDDIRFGIHDLLLASLVENLNDDWKIVLTGCNFFTRKTAVTFHLVRSADCFEVDIDVTILIPFEKVTLYPHADDLNIKQYYIDRLANDKGVIYAIFRYENHAFRPSKAHLEKALLKKESRQRVYTVAKLIVKTFLPTMEVREHCRRCKESIVGSYTLKNILFYMIYFYPDDSCWSDSHFSTRVIELFVILKHCYDQTMHNFVEYVSLKTKHLENKLKYSPSLKLLIPKDVTVTSDIRHGGKWIDKDKEYEGSTFRELSEIHFQMNAKRFGPNAEKYKKTDIKDKVMFSYGHLDGEIRFNPFESTPGKRKIDPKRPQIIHNYATPPLSCFLPSKEEIYDIIDDASFRGEVVKYFCFLQKESWDFKEVITRLVQLLLTEKLPLDVK